MSSVLTIEPRSTELRYEVRLFGWLLGTVGLWVSPLLSPWRGALAQAFKERGQEDALRPIANVLSKLEEKPDANPTD